MIKEYIGECMCLLQLFICDEFEKLDGKVSFEEDVWECEQGGGGFICVIVNGDFIEKGGVVFFVVYGFIGEEMKCLYNMNGNMFYVIGVFIVLYF